MEFEPHSILMMRNLLKEKFKAMNQLQHYGSLFIYFLIRFLYQQNVVTNTNSPISKLSQFLVGLLYADGTDLYAFNSDTDTTIDIVFKAQRLLSD